MIRLCILLFTLLLTAMPCCAQTQSDGLLFKQFSTPDGLPNNMVHQVYQDRDGYIWVATFYGLFRYDGYDVRTLKSNLYTPGLLPNNNVIRVREDGLHRLWIGTHAGLCVYDKPTGYMRKYKAAGLDRQRINDICITPRNKIYLGYIRGMAYYDEALDSVVVMTKKHYKGDVPENVNIQTILEDTNGDLLIGTWQNGLYRLDIKNNRFTHYKPMVSDLSYQCLFRDTDGNLWAGTWGSGLMKCRFSADKKQLITSNYTTQAADPSSVASDYILSISEDARKKNLWIGTRDGVSLMPLATPGRFVNYNESGSEHYFPSHEVNSIIMGNSGLMWLGTQGGGIFHADTHSREFGLFQFRKTGVFSTDQVYDVYVEPNGALWAGVGYGVGYHHGEQTLRVTSQKQPYNISYSQSTDEVLLAVHDDGVYACRNGKVVHHYRVENCGFIPHNLVSVVFEDRSGNWWLGSYQGLGVRYRDGRSYCFNQLENVDKLLAQEITDIVDDADGSLWLATNNRGVIHLFGNLNKPQSVRCKSYNLENGLLPVNTPLCVKRDKKGRIWAGTEGSGLCLLNTDTDCFESVHLKYSLPGDMVGSIEEDENGNLWMGTNQGIACLHLNAQGQGVARVFTVSDGLPDNFFSKNSSCYRNGVLYFGCSRGVVSFHASISERKGTDVSLRITDIKVGGKSLSDMPEIEAGIISPYTSDFTQKLVIPARYNNFSIQFASLTYSMPLQNKYAYRLKGFDRDWIYVDSKSRTAYYSNLQSGTYTFELRGTNENGEWSSIRTIEVVVKPPFYATWWAYLIYIVLVSVVAFFFVNEGRRRLRLRNQLHLQEMATGKVEELNHVKLQFFTNITHELMTPLTIISASLDELKEKNQTYSELLNTMDINVQRLIRLLQQILEFRKAESGNLKLRVSKDNLSLFIRHEAESFEPLIRKRQLHFSVLCENEAMEGYFDSDKLDKILYNLLSNAAKYSRKDGYIQLSLRYLPNKEFIQISVKDNGKGISKERQKTLFTRFYEGDYRQFHTIGTGIGLSLIRDLVKLHRGTIRVESEEEQGSEFLVEIPIVREAYNDEEIILVDADAGATQNQIADRQHYEATQPADEVKAPDEQAATVLLVEDNEELLSVMERLLRHDYHVLTAANGKEALEIAEHEDVSIIVSDVIMPEMDGIELTRRIKSNLEICHIPVVLLTAKRTEKDRDEGYTAGADAYLTKPFHLSALHARIQNLLRVKERTANDFKKQLAFEIKDLDYTDMDEKFLQDAIACVNKHLSDSEFDVPQFTVEMSTSRTTLYKKLRSLTGLNTTSFVRNIRLKAACKLMEENRNIRISDLAYTVGFNDPKYFSICFKKEFGMQPSEYCERFTGGKAIEE